MNLNNKITLVLIMPKMEEEKDFHYVPLGLLSIAAAIDDMSNIQYEIFDERVDEISKLTEMLNNTDVVGLSMFTGYQTKRAFNLLNIVKKVNSNIFTIVGGPHPTALPIETIKSDLIDCVIAGYAEKPFRDVVLDLVSYGKVNSMIPGVYLKQYNVDKLPEISFLDTPKRYKDVVWNAIPYHKIAIEKYINPSSKRVIYVSQYGCPAKCTFCATPETRKWIEKPLELVKNDIRKLYKMTSFKQIVFFDATLFTRKSRVKEIINFISTEFSGTEWVSDARAKELKNYSVDDLLEINKDNLKIKHLTVGLESGSKRIVEKIYKKGSGHLELFLDSARKLNEANIPLASGCIFGAPTETASDLYETLKYISSVKKVHKNFKISTTFFRPLPGTELFDFVKQFGIKYPSSFEEWAKLEGITHYEYNKWMSIPWMNAKEEKEYLNAYNDFIKEHSDIMI